MLTVDVKNNTTTRKVSADQALPQSVKILKESLTGLWVLQISSVENEERVYVGFPSEVLRSLIISIFLYACESWIFSIEIQKRTQAFGLLLKITEQLVQGPCH